MDKEYLISLSREAILVKLNEWFGSGLLSTTDLIEKSMNEVERMSNKGEVSYTFIPKVLYTGGEDNEWVLEEFNALCVGCRLLSPLNAKVQKKIKTLYGLHKAVLVGKIDRFKYGGVIIYID